MGSNPERFPVANVLGVGVHAIDMPTAVSAIVDTATQSQRLGFVTVTGVHGVMESQRDPQIKAIHNSSYLTVPDGTPTVWVGRRQGHTGMATVYGPHLMDRVLRAGLPLGLRHFLLGGGDGVAEQLQAALRRDYPGVEIVGIATPPFRPYTPAEEIEVCDQVRRSDPHIVWVGLSTPKQEQLMAGLVARHGDLLQPDGHGRLLIGVGAAFDFKAGLVRDQPDWIVGTGLGWAYRLTQDPRRLWRRYARNNPAFVAKSVRQMVSPQRFPLDRS